MRLNKFLAAAGVASRRKADKLILSGQIKINGQVKKEPYYDVVMEKDKVVFLLFYLLYLLDLVLLTTYLKLLMHLLLLILIVY